MTNLNNMRQEYHLSAIRDDGLDPDPFVVFDEWFNAAVSAQVPEANAMVLATTDAKNHPTARTVLLKFYDKNGFVFFTNFESRKAQDITANPKVALMFWWGKVVRQVRIEGVAHKLDDKHADDYFASRPRHSCIAAWVSQQSQAVPDREALEAAYAEAEARFAGEETIPRPPFWGGYVVVPTRFEFWQGSDHRLHDRFSYQFTDKAWQINRLAP